MKYIVLLSCLMFTACNSATVQLIPGPAGAAGDTGLQGLPGASGHSLVSETNSATWCECDSQGGSRLDVYLDMDDSLSLTEGDMFQSALVACNGANGLNGQDGLAGTEGAQGIPGATGPQGLTGDTGLSGPAGAVGPSGPQGVAGPTGAQGIAGATGAQGAAGSGATLQAYTLGSSCQSVGGGFYAKKSGNDAAVYDASGCGGGDHVATLHGSYGSLWLSTTRLAFADDTSGVVLRVLNFN